MENVLIVIHLIVVIALVIVVLLQRSEGGGLGIGGGGGGGMMSARGKADTLTRTTAILGAAFFFTSVALGVVGRYGSNPTDILDRIGNTPVETQQGVPTDGGVLDQLGGEQSAPAGGTAVPTE